MKVHTMDQWEGHAPDYWADRWKAGAVRFYERIGSTNDVAAELAAGGAPHFSVVVAEEQFRGRGRGGSSWHAQPGSSILCSVMLRLDEPGSAPGCAPIRIGLALAEAVSEIAGVEAQVKWPNDVVLPGHGKIAGVLCEGALSGRPGGYIVAGLGINIAQTAEDFGELADRACSIRSATGRTVNRGDLLSALLDRIHAFDGVITQPLTADELARLEARDILREREITCDSGNGELSSGTASGIAPDGALMVRQHNEVRAVYSGTVRLSETHAYPGTVGNS